MSFMKWNMICNRFRFIAIVSLLSSDSIHLEDAARAISTLLQTLFRLIPCVAGYKQFVEVREVCSYEFDFIATTI